MSKNIRISTACTPGQTVGQIIAASPLASADQAAEAVDYLLQHSPETVSDLATIVLGATIHFVRMRALGDLNAEGEHVRKFLVELCEHAGLNIQLTAIKPESSPEQDHL